MEENKSQTVDTTPLPGEDLLPTLLPEAKIPQKPRSKHWVGILIAIIIIPLIGAAAQLPQTLTGMAAKIKCTKITRVAIDPGVLNTSINAGITQLSTLAYDVNGRPINSGVYYSWGISSTNSIGTVRSKENLGTFYPKNPGRGDLYVQAINSCTKNGVIGSVLVTVN